MIVGTSELSSVCWLDQSVSHSRKHNFMKSTVHRSTEEATPSDVNSARRDESAASDRRHYSAQKDSHDRTSSIFSARHWPLLIAYVVFPISQILDRRLGLGLGRIWLEGVWLIWAVFCLLIVMLTGRGRELRSRRSKRLLGLSVAFIGLVGLRWSWSIFDPGVVLVPYLMEAKPAIYLAIYIVCVAAFGHPKSWAYGRYGVLLGFIASAEFVVLSLAEGELVIPRVSGERNYDACLLLMSLVTVLTSKREHPRWVLTFIFLGLLFTFSRTALFACGIVVLVFGKSRMSIKLASAALVVVSFILSFLVRDLPIGDLESMDRYWMWAVAGNHFSSFSVDSLIGFDIGKPLDLEIPRSLEWLWLSQAETWGLQGIFPFHFHAFYLRVGLTWGIPIAVAVLLFLGYTAYSRKDNPLLRALCVVMLIESGTMGLFYLSNVGLPLWLVVMSALQRD